MTRPKRNDETTNLTKQELLRALTEDDALKKLMQKLPQEVLEEGPHVRADGDVWAGRLHAPREAITEELCGHDFSACAVSDINKKLN